MTDSRHHAHTQHRNEHEQTHHDGKAGHDGKYKAGFDHVAQFLAGDAQLQTVVVGLFEVDQRECGNVQKTADDQRQQQRALDDIFHGCHRLSFL